MRNFSETRSRGVGHWQIRRLEWPDIEGLMQVQEACYGADYMESAEVYRARLACTTQCSLAVVDGNTVLAYLAAYRSNLGSITPIHGGFSVSPLPDTLYLHDMAVRPDCAGQGLAAALFEALWREAQTWSPRYSALVSVQGSQGYWAQKGYALHTRLTQENAEALRSYGDDAVYMTQPYVQP
ncbi:GNAT family N-acetyltransferase [Ottowia sp. VDI28]|uniref:GNAT family N-acetyltransferase n=1 Tax=Ottowia sp. VDI28 TaxID=3133968 RepID=UPI003C2AC38F